MISRILNIIVLFVAFTLGYAVSERDCLSERLALEVSLKESYEATINKFELEQERLQNIVNDYRKKSDSLDAYTADLRMQLKRATEASLYKSSTSDKCASGWIKKMATVVDGATDIIAERDKIALEYNELREQCKLR